MLQTRRILDETTFTPYIASAEAKWADHVEDNSIHGHYPNYKTIYAIDAEKDDYVRAQIQFNAPADDKSRDLLRYVVGCDGSGKMYSVEALERYGLKFQFEVPSRNGAWGDAYIAKKNGTNQQEFVALRDGRFVDAIVPSVDGTNNNRTAIGKSPIIRVKLVDTKNNNYLLDEAF